jgi:hypothetical protein
MPKEECAVSVQRWEKREGMPVHRHQHDRMGSVYAFSSELDAWVQSRKLHLEQEEDKQADTPADAEADRRPSQTWRLRRWLVLAGVAAVAFFTSRWRYTAISFHESSRSSGTLTDGGVPGDGSAIAPPDWSAGMRARELDCSAVAGNP